MDASANLEIGEPKVGGESEGGEPECTSEEEEGEEEDDDLLKNFLQSPNLPYCKIPT